MDFNPKNITTMNKKQKEILYKEFKVNEHFSITRDDYEGMPCAMIAFNWSDEKMQDLANKIEQELCPYDENNEEGMLDDFWATMENVAVRNGMGYYEDLSDEEFDKLEKEWKEIS